MSVKTKRKSNKKHRTNDYSSKSHTHTLKNRKTQSDSKFLYSHNIDENELIEKELDIVRNNVDKLQDITKKQEVNSPIIKEIIRVVERFLQDNSLICYGGTAINNILPSENRFYDYSKEIPDYDFFSKNALQDAKRLADIYVEQGFTEVEAKSGIHTGTYKVFVNFIPIADITQLDSDIFDNLLKQSIDIMGISCAPPDYLRMSMYLELSRPRGDTSRWEKVARRLALLNNAYPLKTKTNCHDLDFSNAIKCKKEECAVHEKNRILTLQHLINLGVVFFGGYASSIYSKYMDKKKQTQLKHIPYYDVISNDAERDVLLLKAKLKYDGVADIKIKKYDGVYENIPVHYKVSSGNKPLVYIYQSLACHNYNVIRIDNTNINIATIDTMLNMYLVFLFTNQRHLNNNRIVCMASFIFELHQKHILNQSGVFRRFNLPCKGYQNTIIDIRKEKSEKYEELKNKQGSTEFEKHFLRYMPNETVKQDRTVRAKTEKKKKNRKTN
jgi:hypothetical protein